ncbi:Tautomerase-3 domain-containing protein [Mycena chlorophos]|uniref:Tautomerase-3 domain-containing protein n=1 Tax=Mycena chlorophos TaxID=658473 RepID=A0A8H6SVX6_MYCCL|nr:Tautomerase-3 domain-containing protein [Mycena chlorophos]
MPIHRWTIPKGLYTRSDKAAIAKAITAVYAGLPKFYVVVIFNEREDGDFYWGEREVGAEGEGKFVSIEVEHLARTFGTAQRRKDFMDYYEGAISPWTKGRGVNWELQVMEGGERDLWQMNGTAPPKARSIEEFIWKKENRVVSAKEMKAIKARL